VIESSQRETAVDLQNLFSTPAGYRFAYGYLVTYDLSVDTLVRRVLAPLTGVPPEDDLAIGLADPVLTVVHERLHTGRVLPYRVDLVPLGAGDGRPLHVKAGLLRFDPDDGRRSPLLRAYVGSANLTEGGFGGNAEVILASQQTPDAADPVCGAVATICRAVARESQTMPALRHVLGPFGSLRAPAGTLFHTITTTTPLLAGVRVPEGFDQLDIVTPVFQSRGSGPTLARALGPILPPSGGKVNIYTSTAAPLENEQEQAHRTAFPVSLVQELEQRGLDVEVHFTPEWRSGRQRRLHAKVFALHGSSESVVLVGSANCTVSGLAGSNREALATVRLPRDEAEDFVQGGFDGWTWTGLELDEGMLKSLDYGASGGAAIPYVWAVFVPHPDSAHDPARSWKGSLTLSGLEPGSAVTISFGGVTWKAVVDRDGEIDLATESTSPTVPLMPAQGSMRLTIDARSFEVAIHVDAEPEWYQLMLDRRDEPPRSRTARDVFEHQLLLGGLRQAERLRSKARKGSSPSANEAGDDRISLPIDRRFDIVARHGSNMSTPQMDETLATYLDAEVADPRYVVGRAVMHTHGQADDDPLLRSLQAAMRERDRARR
jgi:hypothetical protein